MKGKRFSEEKIIGVLKEPEAGAETKELCRRHGISEQSFYRWKAKYGGMDVSDAKKLHALYDSDPFIKNEWAVLRERLAEAYLLTIFGYRAPATDELAIRALRDSWQQNRSFDLAEVEIINIEPRRNLVNTWKAFFCRDHFAISRALSSSFLCRHPRRSDEAFAFASLQGSPWKDNFLPRYRSVERLERWLQPLLTEEAREMITGRPCPPVPRRPSVR